jgi:hypothetical protein
MEAHGVVLGCLHRRNDCWLLLLTGMAREYPSPMKTLFSLLLFAPLALPAQNPHSVTLNWTCPANATPPPATSCQNIGFLVQRGTTTGGPYTTIATLTSPQVFTYTDASSSSNVLVEGTAYFYVVIATGNGGLVSAASPELKETIPFLQPLAPATLSGSVK